MRYPLVAGRFYPGSEEGLRNELEKTFSNIQIASLPDKKIRLGIAPHAGYAFSGKCAAFLYSLLRKQKFDTVIILGTNHSSLGENICFSIEDFETPLGVVINDVQVVEDLILKIRKTDIKVGVDNHAHKYEHSIEVQLPFLQFVQPKAKIVPVLIRDLGIKDVEKIGKIFSNLVQEQENDGKKIFVLASSDLTHYGKDYGFLPFTDNIKANLYDLDGGVIESILKLDLEEFYIKSRKTTICGHVPILVGMQIAKNLKLSGEKLCYYTSGDILDKWDSVVGYTSIVFS